MIKLFNLPLSIIAKIRPSMWISAVLAVCFGIYFYTQQHDSDTKTPSRDKEQLELVLADIEYRWIEGFLKSEIDFSKYTDIPASEFIYEVSKCNPKLLGMYLRGALKHKPKWTSKGYRFVKNTMQTSKGRITRFTLLDQKNNKKIHIRLSHQCREIKLPKKKYSAGPKNKDNFIWDNFSYDIYIDRFYVSQTEVLEWKEARGIEYQHKISEENISTQLSLSERHQFCVDKGGLLLQSHVFDAAVFYPTEVHLNKKNYKFRYPWGREDFDFKLIDKANCEKFPVGECYQKFHYKNYEPIGTSWSGVYFAIGGWPESFHNISQSEANLKVSSKFLDVSSHWHENGLRANWSGKVNFPNSINLTEQNFGRLIPADNIEGVAFRCMYYR